MQIVHNAVRVSAFVYSGSYGHCEQFVSSGSMAVTAEFTHHGQIAGVRAGSGTWIFPVVVYSVQIVILDNFYHCCYELVA